MLNSLLLSNWKMPVGIKNIVITDKQEQCPWHGQGENKEREK